MIHADHVIALDGVDQGRAAVEIGESGECDCRAVMQTAAVEQGAAPTP
jgi:hypothetical protein